MPKRSKSNRKSRRGSSRSSGWRQPRASLSGFSNMQSHVFRLSGATSVVSDGSGVVSGYSYNDPTSTFGNYTEHVSYLANLFTEMRIVRSRWHLVSQLTGLLNETKLAQNPVFAVGVFTRTPSSLPSVTSVNQVLDNQPSKIWNIAADTTQTGLIMSARFNVVNYQLTTTTSTDYAGCPGGILFYGGGFPLSQACFAIHWEVFIQYRGRA